MRSGSKLLIVGCLACALAACGKAPESDNAADTATAPAAPGVSAPASAKPAARPDEALMAQWARSCALCHVNGEGGAPRLGDAEAWAPRLAQGEDVLLQHTIEGLNNMPPLGYCMDCEEEDFRRIIRFMGGQS